MRLRRLLLALAALGLAASVAACGSTDSPSTAKRPLAAASRAAPTGPAGDWSRFGYDAARSNDAPRGLSEATVGALAAHRVDLPGTVDSSPIYVGSARVAGRARPLLVMTTTYGRTLALDPATGAILWQFTPKSYGSLAGSPQITTATPVADPDRKFVYAASPDGLIHKLRLADGSEVRSAGWPASVTRDPTHEKIAAALNLFRGNLLVTTGGYIGDAPPYQGHVVVMGAKHGRLLHVWNSLCSGHHGLIYPPRCTPSNSAIWGRAGAVVVPGSSKLLVATGNGPWDGHANWGDSVLVLSAKAKLVGNYTPTNNAQLNVQDIDLGSTSPVYLTSKLIAQGGKDGKIRLLSLRRLRGTRPHKGHELQIVATPSGTDLFTAPAVWRNGKQVWLIAADGGGTQAWSLSGGRLHSVWRNRNGGTSPVLAGGLLFVYDPGGALRVYRPANGKLVATLSSGSGHWNSPIVTEGRVALPEGDANDHDTSGILDIWRLSG